MVVSRITRMTTAAAATSSKTKNSRGLAIFSKEGPYASHMVRLRPVLTSHPGLVPEIPQVPSTSTANTNAQEVSDQEANDDEGGECESLGEEKNKR